jgi:hypothetical protein
MEDGGRRKIFAAEECMRQHSINEVRIRGLESRKESAGI